MHRVRRSPAVARRLGIETLERRELLAGNIQVTLQSGLLTITGDDQRNHARVYQQPNGRFNVSVLGAETITGATTNLLVRGIVADLRDDSDHLTIAAEPELLARELLPAAVIGQITVRGRGGFDTINLSVIGHALCGFLGRQTCECDQLQ